MSQNAWLTPDEFPASANCFRVSVPDSLFFEAVFRGALLLLTYAENWEQHGAKTPDETADYWWEFVQNAIEMVPCQPGGGGEMYIGQVFVYPSLTPPDGALLCDGSEYSTTVYPDLFAVLGYDWGGSGATFAVPDLRGQFVRGASSTLAVGDTGGEEEVTLGINNLPGHSHAVRVGISAGGVPVPGFAQLPRSAETDDTLTTGADYAHNNLPPYTALAVMIKAE